MLWNLVKHRDKFLYLLYDIYKYRSRDNLVVQRWATGWMIGVLGFDSHWGLGIFPFTTASRTALKPTQPPIQRVQGALPWG
jgi:hypothetical protein